ncbi:hypothetical protein BJX70DRAFT_395703 [Aspergillus crustosus]
MSRLRTFGSVRTQVDPVSVSLARPRTQLHSRLHQSRVPVRANPGPTARSFVPSLPRQTKDSVRSLPEPRQGSRPTATRSYEPSLPRQPKIIVRSFNEPRQGSRLTATVSYEPSLPRQPKVIVRSLPEFRPATTRSASPTQRPSFLRHSIVEERRAAREARSRPWTTQRSSSSTQSSLSSRTTHTTIPDSKKPTARSGYVRAKPEASARGVRKTKPVKSVRFAEETTVVSVTRWITPPKTVTFGETTVIPPAPWEHKSSAKTVSFGCRKAVVPVTRWIDRVKHVFTPLRRRKRSLQALSSAQVDETGMSSDVFTPRPRRGLRGKPVRNVHFGEVTEISVDRWIVPCVDVHPEPTDIKGRRLQGWSVTPLSKPDKHGLMERYTTSWKSHSYVMLPKHSKTPCDHGNNCSYNLLAQIQAKHREWTPRLLVGRNVALQRRPHRPTPDDRPPTTTPYPFFGLPPGMLDSWLSNAGWLVGTLIFQLDWFLVGNVLEDVLEVGLGVEDD